MDVQSVSLSTTCSLECTGFPFTTTNNSFFKCQNFGLSGIQSAWYQNVQKFWWRNLSGTGIRGPSWVPECSVTVLRYRMPECRCWRHWSWCQCWWHWPWCQCPAMMFCLRPSPVYSLHSVLQYINMIIRIKVLRVRTTHTLKYVLCSCRCSWPGFPRSFIMILWIKKDQEYLRFYILE